MSEAPAADHISLRTFHCTIIVSQTIIQASDALPQQSKLVFASTFFYFMPLFIIIFTMSLCAFVSVH